MIDAMMMEITWYGSIAFEKVGDLIWVIITNETKICWFTDSK